MRTRITIWLMCVAAVLTWTGVAGAQTATPAPKVQLPSGEVVWDLTGDWETLIEPYGPWAGYSTYTSVTRITQTGSAVSGIRLRDSPPANAGRAGSPNLRGELEKNGFKRVEMITGPGVPVPCQGQISEDGKKIILDDGQMLRNTLTRQ